MDVPSRGWHAGYSAQQWAERRATASSRGCPMPPTAWHIRPHLWWSRRTTARSYSDQDVLRLLGPSDPAPEERSRAEAVRACAARPASWMDRLDAAETRELGRLVPRLPTIVFWYYVGVPADEIGCRVGHFQGAWEAERALRVISRCIARQLNDPRYRT